MLHNRLLINSQTLLLFGLVLFSYDKSINSSLKAVLLHEGMTCQVQGV